MLLIFVKYIYFSVGTYKKTRFTAIGNDNIKINFLFFIHQYFFLPAVRY